mmetsp:Transcript_5029/g.11160  ORF Transcript_5029/g.11160 Transcript_5029/m.11160 type:complete len:306 (+) Transcript_5029:174-1091(+)
MPRYGVGPACCSFPNGCFAILPASLSIIATILSTAAWSSCHFARVRVVEQPSLAYDIGMFHRETTLIDIDLDIEGDYLAYVYVKGCAQYTALEQEVALDSHFTAARGFSVLAGVVGFHLMVVAWIVAPCVATPRLVWGIIGGFFVLNGIFQMLTLLIFASKSCETCLIGMWGGAQADFECDAQCKLASGGSTAVVAGLLWVLSGALCFCINDVDYREPVKTPVAFATREGEVEMGAVAEAVPADDKAVSRVAETGGLESGTDFNEANGDEVDGGGEEEDAKRDERKMPAVTATKVMSVENEGEFA